MIRVQTGLAASLLLGALMLSSAATALTITNRGTTPQEITVRIGDLAETVTLQPNESRKDLCPAPEGCVITHASGDEFPLKGTENVDVDETGLSIPE